MYIVHRKHRVLCILHTENTGALRIMHTENTGALESPIK